MNRCQIRLALLPRTRVLVSVCFAGAAVGHGRRAVKLARGASGAGWRDRHNGAAAHDLTAETSIMGAYRWRWLACCWSEAWLTAW